MTHSGVIAVMPAQQNLVSSCATAVGLCANDRVRQCALWTVHLRAVPRVDCAWVSGIHAGLAPRNLGETNKFLYSSVWLRRGKATTLVRRASIPVNHNQPKGVNEKGDSDDKTLSIQIYM
jgi:hypothetical protein